MTPLIQTDRDREVVVTIAQSWIGTPYAADGAVKGSGCSCSMLPYAILGEVPFDLPQPQRRGRMKKKDILGAMEDFLTNLEGSKFQKIEKLEDVLAGDVMLFDAGVGHLALSLGDGKLIHSWQSIGVHQTTIGSASYSKRFVSAWRPISS